MTSVVQRSIARQTRFLLWLAVWFIPMSVSAAPGDMRISLMAAKIDWDANEFSGYAFLCIESETGSGTNDDCYSFFRTAANKAFVGGSGVARTDLRKTPTRFPSPTVSVTRRLTAAQRQAALKLIDAWNQREYELSAVNSIELVRDVAQATGFTLPPRKNESSEGLLKRLQAFNR